MEDETNNTNTGRPGQLCFCLIEDKPESHGSERAVLVKGVRWNPNSRIQVAFLNGGIDLQKRVSRVAQAWTASDTASLLSIERVNDIQTAQIRVSFCYTGSWSLLGTSYLQRTDKTLTTMNFGWLRPASSDEELNRVVLHEFGHTLGLIHEHQSPAGAFRGTKTPCMPRFPVRPTTGTKRKLMPICSTRSMRAKPTSPPSIPCPS